MVNETKWDRRLCGSALPICRHANTGYRPFDRKPKVSCVFQTHWGHPYQSHPSSDTPFHWFLVFLPRGIGTWANQSCWITKHLFLSFAAVVPNVNVLASYMYIIYKSVYPPPPFEPYPLCITMSNVHDSGIRQILCEGSAPLTTPSLLHDPKVIKEAEFCHGGGGGGLIPFVPYLPIFRTCSCCYGIKKADFGQNECPLFSLCPHLPQGPNPGNPTSVALHVT